jgi:hypothetical protein
MEPGILIAIIGAIATVIATVVTVIATRGKAKVDAKAALDARIDARVDQQLQTAWTQIDALHAQNQAQASQIKILEAHAEIAERREVLIYRHTRALRDHIIKQLPPPPPTMPTELMKWFEQWDGTDPDAATE